MIDGAEEWTPARGELRLSFDHTDEDGNHCGFDIGPLAGCDGASSLTFEFSGLDGEPPTSRDEANLRRWQSEYEAHVIARALRVATDEELRAAGLAPRAMGAPVERFIRACEVARQRRSGVNTPEVDAVRSAGNDLLSAGGDIADARLDQGTS